MSGFKGAVFAGGVLLSALASAGLPRLVARDGHFVDEKGSAVRFWGVNLVSVYPADEECESLAGELAALNVNLVRHHHLMRPSRDWVVRAAPTCALALYKDNSVDPDPEAWRRFDKLNAALRRKGIYLQLSIHFSRVFQPGDAFADDPSRSADAEAWAKAVAEINSWPWNKSIDVRKILPIIDSRAARLQRRFATELLTHVNPSTGLSYAEDPQVLTWEIVNESSIGYALICGNSLPDYFEAKLQAKWKTFAAARGFRSDVPDCRSVKDPALLKVRAEFYTKLDETYATAMRKVIRDAGSRAAITFSNLWRGEDTMAWRARDDDFVEDHAYVNPVVAAQDRDWLDEKLETTRLEGKPYILGEFNELEGDRHRDKGYARTSLLLQAAAYGLYQDLDGIVWFAYCHGDRDVGRHWRGRSERRDMDIGTLCADGQLLDHYALLGRVFREGLVRKASRFDVLLPKYPVRATNYGQLMGVSVHLPVRGASSLRGYVKRVDAVRARGEVAGDSESSRPKPAAPGVLVSDTGELVRDIVRGQMCVSAPRFEAFTGKTGSETYRPLAHLSLTERGDLVYATVCAYAEKTAFRTARRIWLSRTGIGPDYEDARIAPGIRLRGIRAGKWTLRILRPDAVAETLREYVGSATVSVKSTEDGVELPAGTWHTAVLEAVD